MKITNHWYVNRGQHPSPVGSAVIKAVEPFNPSSLELRREDGLPWVEITFEEVLPPATALAIGRAIQEAANWPVHFIELHATGVTFMVAGDFLLDEGATYYPGKFDEYGEALEVVEAVWRL